MENKKDTNLRIVEIRCPYCGYSYQSIESEITCFVCRCIIRSKED